jgi:hypothetical protein
LGSVIESGILKEKVRRTQSWKKMPIAVGWGARRGVVCFKKNFVYDDSWENICFALNLEKKLNGLDWTEFN